MFGNIDEKQNIIMCISNWFNQSKTTIIIFAGIEAYLIEITQMANGTEILRVELPTVYPVTAIKRHFSAAIQVQLRNRKHKEWFECGKRSNSIGAAKSRPRDVYEILLLMVSHFRNQLYRIIHRLLTCVSKKMNSKCKFLRISNELCFGNANAWTNHAN